MRGGLCVTSAACAFLRTFESLTAPGGSYFAAGMAPSKARGRKAAGGKPLLLPTDFTSYLREKSEELAPGDLQPILDQAEQVHHRAEQVREAHPRLSRHVELALQIVEDHAEEECPQIPYYTISLLAVSLLYLVDPIDVIPDWIPGVGSADDALLFELAFKLGRPGIERYCVWKGIPTEGLLPQEKVAAAPGRKPAAGRKKAKK